MADGEDSGDGGRGRAAWLRRVDCRGTIVNLSSNAGIATRAGFGLYSASKFAVKAVSEALAQEMREHAVKAALWDEIAESSVFRE